jgi:hypothetical protein
VDIFLALATSLLGPFITVLILRVFLKPRIIVANKICEIPGPHGIYYLFKIINEANRGAIDIRVNLHRLKTPSEGYGEGDMTLKIPLVTEEILALGPFDPDAQRHNFYYRLRTESGVNLRGMATKESFKCFRLRLLTRDALSQIEMVQDQFFGTDDIVEGIFEPGNSTAIKPFDKTEG